MDGSETSSEGARTTYQVEIVHQMDNRVRVSPVMLDDNQLNCVITMRHHYSLVEYLAVHVHHYEMIVPIQHRRDDSDDDVEEKRWSDEQYSALIKVVVYL
jgi:hypothetical protein